ncbi:IS1595 family transposase [Belliella sp. DSM 111904]|uniref:IS1595 family transposase n=1 Tax=Belliella filtrata TaxID=2923435 RepID=A0ABS9V3U0_9BACT|nr:IS1595 family transposase [Belliella filtrata]MCH7411082.1 IS1595 family transposase [Belliella filtrata]
MNIIDFITHFPDEESCEKFLKAYREKEGVYCKTCSSFTRQYWFSGKKFFGCSKCRRRTSLKAGTINGIQYSYIAHLVYGFSVEGFVNEAIDKESVLITDKNQAYVSLERFVEYRIKLKSSEKSTNDELNWVHTAISNLKKNLLGIYHLVTEKYLQNYLDEFVYKLNRRYFGEKLFDRLIIAAIQTYV